MPLNHGARRGWTLVELLVVLVLTVLVAGAALASLTAGQRSARVEREIRAARADLRDAAVVLTQELRGASLADTIRFASDTAVELFTPILTGVVCAASSGDQLLIASLPSTAAPAAGDITPDTGDLVWVWRGDSILPPGSWVRAAIAAVNTNVADPCDAEIAAGPAQAAVALEASTGAVESGAPVQFVRRGRHNIYRASDGGWYLGYRRCDALGPSRCQAVQPVAGPYRVRAAGASGLEFRYFAPDGTPATVLTDVARVEFLVRSDVAGAARRAPGRTSLNDSAAMSVSLRNAF